VLDDAIAWLSVLAGRAVNPTNKPSVERLSLGLDFIRQQLTLMHFGEALDVAAINERLSNLRLHLVAPAGISAGSLPALQASFGTGAATDNDDALPETIEATVLLEFAVTVGAYLDDPSRCPVGRCEGIYKEPGSLRLSPAANLDSSLELRWRKEIAALNEHGLVDASEVKRCIDFFPLRPKARFCSDECRFRTFQLTKTLSEPDYLAAKQRRYRQRQDD
jgi:hypothetical protein